MLTTLFASNQGALISVKEQGCIFQQEPVCQVWVSDIPSELYSLHSLVALTSLKKKKKFPGPDISIISPQCPKASGTIGSFCLQGPRACNLLPFLIPSLSCKGSSSFWRVIDGPKDNRAEVNCVRPIAQKYDSWRLGRGYCPLCHSGQSLQSIVSFKGLSSWEGVSSRGLEERHIFTQLCLLFVVLRSCMTSLEMI